MYVCMYVCMYVGICYVVVRGLGFGIVGLRIGPCRFELGHYGLSFSMLGRRPGFRALRCSAGFGTAKCN